VLTELYVVHNNSQKTPNILKKYLRAVQRSWKIVPLQEPRKSCMLLLCFEQQTEELNH
jgi:hypothetical protein